MTKVLAFYIRNQKDAPVDPFFQVFTEMLGKITGESNFEKRMRLWRVLEVLFDKNLYLWGKYMKFIGFFKGDLDFALKNNKSVKAFGKMEGACKTKMSQASYERIFSTMSLPKLYEKLEKEKKEKEEEKLQNEALEKAKSALLKATEESGITQVATKEEEKAILIEEAPKAKEESSSMALEKSNETKETSDQCQSKGDSNNLASQNVPSENSQPFEGKASPLKKIESSEMESALAPNPVQAPATVPAPAPTLATALATALASAPATALATAPAPAQAPGPALVLAPVSIDNHQNESNPAINVTPVIHVPFQPPQNQIPLVQNTETLGSMTTSETTPVQKEVSHLLLSHVPAPPPVEQPQPSIDK